MAYSEKLAGFMACSSAIDTSTTVTGITTASNLPLSTADALWINEISVNKLITWKGRCHTATGILLLGCELLFSASVSL